MQTDERTDIMKLRGALFCDYPNARKNSLSSVFYLFKSNARCMPSIRSASPRTRLPLIGKGDSKMAFLNGTLEEQD